MPSCKTCGQPAVEKYIMQPWSDGLPIPFCSNKCFAAFMLGGSDNPVDTVLRFAMAAYPDREVDWESFAKLMQHYDAPVNCAECDKPLMTDDQIVFPVQYEADSACCSQACADAWLEAKEHQDDPA